MKTVSGVGDGDLEWAMLFLRIAREVVMKTLMMVGALLLATYVGTTTAQQSQPEPRDANGMMSMMKDCPMNVEGAEITAEDTTNGVALTITTKSGNINELRERVQRMLDMHGVTAKTEAAPNGARFTLTPKDPAQLP